MSGFFKKKFNKGFSLISVLVGSMTGLIVMLGLTKAFVNMNTKAMDIQSELKIQDLNNRIVSILDNTCSFKHLEEQIPLGISPYTVEKAYGLNYSKGINYFDLKEEGDLCKIKLYYQVDNKINYSQFACHKESSSCYCSKGKDYNASTKICTPSPDST